MSIWSLEPIDTSNDNWRRSRYCGPVLIRAADVQRARAIATLALGVAAEHVPGSEIPVNPWNKVDLVSCSRANDTTFDEEGPEQILDPPEYDGEWRRGVGPRSGGRI